MKALLADARKRPNRIAANRVDVTIVQATLALVNVGARAATSATTVSLVTGARKRADRVDARSRLRVAIVQIVVGTFVDVDAIFTVARVAPFALAAVASR